MSIEQPTNQHELVLFYLLELDEFSLLDVIKDSMFFKFQTRLSEIEAKLNKSIATRKRVKFVNRFNTKSTYYVYQAIDKSEIKALYLEMKG